MLNSEGKECFERQGIADIVADFYEELYRSKRSDDNAFPEEGAACGLPACEKDVVPFSKEELVVAIKKLKNNKCKDTSGVVGEMFKHAGPQLREILLDLYNEVLKGSETPPQKWKESVVRVLYKSGPSNAAANYRPITIIPLLYKLFAILLLNRIEPTIEKQQSTDQAAYRKGYSTDDHLFVFAQLHEKTLEHRLDYWIAAIDFRKAFDSIEHDSLWGALLDQGVETQ